MPFLVWPKSGLPVPWLVLLTANIHTLNGARTKVVHDKTLLCTLAPQLVWPWSLCRACFCKWTVHERLKWLFTRAEVFTRVRVCARARLTHQQHHDAPTAPRGFDDDARSQFCRTCHIIYINNMTGCTCTRRSATRAHAFLCDALVRMANACACPLHSRVLAPEDAHAQHQQQPKRLMKCAER